MATTTTTTKQFENLWLEFSGLTIPEDTNSIGVRAMKIAFYCGAFAFMTEMSSMALAVQQMDDMQVEITDFLDSEEVPRVQMGSAL